MAKFSHTEKIQRGADKGNQKLDIGSGTFEMSIRQSSVGSWVHKSHAWKDRDATIRVFIA